MPTIEELIQKAKAAIAAGNLEEAENYTKQAKALKALDGLQLVVDSPELIELRAMKARLENESAVKSGGHLVVTEDETDKKASKPWKSLGEQLKAIADAAMSPHKMDDRLKAQKVILGASEGVPADGGFLVQPEFSAEIFKLAHDGGSILSRVRNANRVDHPLDTSSGRSSGQSRKRRA